MKNQMIFRLETICWAVKIRFLVKWKSNIKLCLHLIQDVDDTLNTIHHLQRKTFKRLLTAIEQIDTAKEFGNIVKLFNSTNVSK